MLKKQEYEGSSVEKIKILFQFLLMLLFSAIGGYFFNRLYFRSIDLIALNEKLILHFEIPFIDCKSLISVIIKVLEYALDDIICIAVCFIGAFTLFCYAICDLVLCFVSFKLSFSLSLLLHLKRVIDDNLLTLYYPGFFKTFLFTFFNFCIIIIVFFYSYKASVIGNRLISRTSTFRRFFNTDAVFRLFFYTVVMLVSVIAVNFIYCLVLYFC